VWSPGSGWVAFLDIRFFCWLAAASSLSDGMFRHLSNWACGPSVARSRDACFFGLELLFWWSVLTALAERGAVATVVHCLYLFFATLRVTCFQRFLRFATAFYPCTWSAESHFGVFHLAKDQEYRGA